MYPPDLTLKKDTFGTREQTGGKQEADRRPHLPLLSLRANRRQDRRRRSLSNVETVFPVVGGLSSTALQSAPAGRAGLSHTRLCPSRASLLSKPGCNCALNSRCFRLFGFLIFPVLCWFLPYGNVTQPSLHTRPLDREPPSPPHPIPSRASQSARLGPLPY